MLNQQLASWRDFLLNPLACSAPRWLKPNAVSLIGLAAGLGTAWAIAVKDWETAMWMFGWNRVADGVDGLLARTRDQATANGAHLDIAVDTASMVAIALSIGSALDLWLLALLLAVAVVVVDALRLNALRTRAAVSRTHSDVAIASGTATAAGRTLATLAIVALLVFPEHGGRLLLIAAAMVILDLRASWPHSARADAH